MKKISAKNDTGGNPRGINVSALLFTVTALVVIILSAGTFEAGRVGSLQRKNNASLFRIEKDSLKLVQQFLNQDKPLGETVAGLDILYTEASDICEQTMSTGYPALALSGALEFNRRKYIMEESCRALSDFLTGMQTVVQFSIFTYSEEAERHKLIVHEMSDEITRLQAIFMDSEIPSIMYDPPAQPSGDSEYYFLFVLSSARADHFGAYGYERDTTPVIDALAREGVKVDEAIAQSPVTTESVASLLSGMYPMSAEVPSMWKDREGISLIEQFENAGFRTAGFSATSNFYERMGYDEAFDYFREMPYARASILINRMTSWLEQSRALNDKIFVVAHLAEPHDPFLAPGRYMDIYAPGTKIRHTIHSIRKNIDSSFAYAGSVFPECDYDPARENLGNTELLLNCLSNISGKEVSTNDVYNLVARYDGELSYADAQIGRFIEYLRIKGLLDKSTIVITSDHGDPLFEHNQVRHSRSIYDEVLNVPLVILPAKGKSVDVVNSQVEVIDVIPTIMELAGVEIPLNIDGVPAIDRYSEKEETYAFGSDGFNYGNGEKYKSFVVRTEKYKYIQNTDPATGEVLYDEFYDISIDPEELTDARKENEKEFMAMRRKLENWRDANTRISLIID